MTNLTKKSNGLHVAASIVLVLPLVLSGCGSIAKRDEPVAIWNQDKPAAPAPVSAATPKKGGGYYLNDGPGDNPPPNLDAIPDAVPRVEPLHRAANRPYTVLGQSYTPNPSLKVYKQVGVASWYGRRYHGQKTSVGEIYDMYAMTAAHPTLPVPSYARVTNLKNRKSVVVRVNDRGPFHSDRLIDLSYTAAHKLDVLAGGSTMVEVELIDPNSYVPVAKTAEPAVATAEKTTPVVATELQPISPAGAGHYVQLGAFSVQENAEVFRGRLKIELAQLADKLQIHPADGLFRVRAGPFANLAEASQAADDIRSSLKINAVLSTR